MPADRLVQLVRLARLLRKPMTASDVAKALDCCKPSAYRRIRELRESGIKIRVTKQASGLKTGPRAAVYRLEG